ncbi:O-antigen ligase family protein [Altericroceibacterium xinjiangense]|uniref:O-antigen ligase family protein n=1 Tax=Altericroceibacterium xinjiangense TaxID=762261 RepID=UPI0013E03E8A|nr:O-antigen ligase family protein [Altericroceibacterium xinjiangense]
MINVVGLLILLFFTGGSSRMDVWSLVLLRPIAVLSLCYGLWALTRADVARYRFLLSMAVLVTGAVAIQLVPLPPFIWQALPGRGIIEAIDDAVGLSGVWRPISLAPQFTWNAFYALAVPLAILVNAVRLDKRDQRWIMLTLIAGGVLTIVAGVAQISGGARSLYFYRISNFGLPAGIFANRNHATLYLAALLPLLGVVIAWRDVDARVARGQRYLALAGALTVVAFLVVAGSRAGLGAGIVGLATFVLIAFVGHGRGGWRAISRAQWIGVAIVLLLGVAIVLWAALTGNAASISRTFDSSMETEARYDVWQLTLAAVPYYMPLGSGAGTFERIFQVLEPDSLLSANYWNHAHNDWLESLLTFGAVGAGLMVVAVFAFVVAATRVGRLPRGYSRSMGGAGLVIVLLLALGSIVDYPLRAPLISALFVLACVWVAKSLETPRTSGGIA